MSSPSDARKSSPKPMAGELVKEEHRLGAKTLCHVLTLLGMLGPLALCLARATPNRRPARSFHTGPQTRSTGSSTVSADFNHPLPAPDRTSIKQVPKLKIVQLASAGSNHRQLLAPPCSTVTHPT